LSHEALILMRARDPELARLRDDALVPAIRAAGLAVSQPETAVGGELFVSGVATLIERVRVVVADVTEPDPNLWIEIGYAMGLGKALNVLLIRRASEQNAGGDLPSLLAGHEVLVWDPARTDEFTQALTSRLRRRLAILGTEAEAVSPWDEEWLAVQRKHAMASLSAIGRTGFMEFAFALSPPKGQWSPSELLEAATESQIQTFGWPIGVVIDTDVYRPHPTGDGIRAEVSVVDSPLRENSYDYWSLRSDGDYYLLQSLFEDQRTKNALYFNTRIVRVTEAVLYCARLCARLEVSPASRIVLRIRHGGLRSRTLRSASARRLHLERTTVVDEVHSEVSFTLESVDAQLVALVNDLVRPVFEVFDFFEVSEEVLKDIVEKFLNGQVT
jgi:hypothetical protein